MKINLFNQNDLRWQKETMGLEVDTLGEFGCLVTCLANISIMLNNTYNPKQLNQKIKELRGYAKLNNPVVNDEIASNLLSFAIEKILNVNVQNTKEFIFDVNSYYIGMIKIKIAKGEITHFVNILNYTKEAVRIFDVWNGIERNINPYEIIQIKRITENVR